jgi:hypothetical protein
MKFLWVGIFVSLVLVSSGCTNGYKTVIGGQSYAPVPMQHTAILLSFPEEGTYKVIGTVSSRGAPLAGDDAVYRKLQKASADLGADAVVVGSAAMAYRCSLPGHAYTSGDVNVYSNGGRYYSGSYSGTTTYTPPMPMYGLDVTGVAIRYTK